MPLNPKIEEIIKNKSGHDKIVKEFAMKVLHHQITFTDTRNTYKASFKRYLEECINQGNQLDINENDSE